MTNTQRLKESKSIALTNDIYTIVDEVASAMMLSKSAAVGVLFIDKHNALFNERWCVESMNGKNIAMPILVALELNDYIGYNLPKTMSKDEALLLKRQRDEGMK